MKLNSLNWSTEVNGLAKTLRKMLNIPKWLYLPVNSDHGMAFESKLEAHEAEALTEIHFTWNKARYEKIKGKQKHIIRIPCPWVYYRRKNNISLSKKRAGTLIFLPHTIIGMDMKLDVVQYVNHIKSKSEIFPSPYTICVHPTDVSKGFLKNAPIIDAVEYTCLGPNTDFDFVDKFYNLVRSYEVATSCNPGSELLYCCEIGLNYYSFGQKPEYIIGDTNKKQQIISNFSDEQAKYFNELAIFLFSINNCNSGVEQKKFISDALSLDLLNDKYINSLRKITFRQYIIKPMILFQYKLKKVFK
jgi:hypothetical protein